MTEMSKKQLEFFTFLILICTVTAALILLIDFQIKGAILEESNRLRRVIESHPTSANGSRFADNTSDDTAYPADLVRSGTASMETSGHSESANGKSPAQGSRRAKPRANDGSGSVSDSDQ